MTKQAELFPASSEAPKPLARRTDPDTSKAAAEELVTSGDLGDRQARALRVVKRYPGKTSRELSHAAGDADPRTINRRLGELERKGLIYRAKKRQCSITGRLCATWRPAEEKA